MNSPRILRAFYSTRVLAISCASIALLLQAVSNSQAAGTIVAWGANDASQCLVPAGLSNVVGVAGGASHSLALKGDGSVVAWGFDLSGQATVPFNLPPAAQVAGGATFSMALLTNGTVVVWGNQSPAPAGLSNVVGIAAGATHCLALKKDGTLLSWGGTQTNVPAGLTNITAVAAGNDYSLALRSDGTVVAWGDNAYGKTNVPADATNVMTIAAGGDHCLVLRRDGSVRGWGRDDSKQASIPAGLTNAIAVAAGALHSVALRADGTLLAWGDNTYFQTVINPTVPGFVFVAAGGYHSLAIRGDNFPFILLQPQSQNVFLTKSATLQVVAAGAVPLSYQWQHSYTNNSYTNLARGTNATLVLNNFQMRDAGYYRVIVANSYSSTNSSDAILTAVGGPPVVITPPRDQSAICGDSATFQVEVDGSGPFRYQWWFASNPIAGATRTSLTLTNLTPADAGIYSVVATNAYGSVTTGAVLTVTVVPPRITSPLTATGKQGVPFNYTIQAIHSPKSFGAVNLPFGLSINKTNGLISGIPLESGTFGATIYAINACTYDIQTLVITVSSSVPVITGPFAMTGTEGSPITPATILATESPIAYGGSSLPIGIFVDSVSGQIWGTPVYAGTFFSTIWASNQWGVASAAVQFTFNNAPVTGLSIDSLTYTYSTPYLLDFAFTLRDSDDPSQGSSVVTEPRLLSAQCYESGQLISPSETGATISRGSSKLFKTYLVLDFTESIASLANGDTNGDFISDAVDNLVAGAQYFVNQQSADAQVGVFEFHRDDVAPSNVVALTTNKAMLNSAIAGIWTNQVNWYPAGSRCWDAVSAAITAIGTTNRDEQHYLIFVSDGKDESSTNTLAACIKAATNNAVKVYCIGFGPELDPAPLQTITTQTGGRYYQAATSGEISAKFSQISKDLQGQYILRWATLRRGSKSFMPSFSITYQGFTADSPTNPITPPVTNIDDTTTPPTTNITPAITNFVIGNYVPNSNAGPVTVGSLRLVSDTEVLPSAVTIRATYIPRYVRQLRLHYRANWPCTASLQSTGTGEMLNTWTLTETSDGAGGSWLLLSSTNPANIATSLPFAAFGRLLTFTFKDVINPASAFSELSVDNTLYTNTGGQSFVFENTNAFVTPYPVLPRGTPVPWMLANGLVASPLGELADKDGDGLANWQEYRANTNPNDANSKLVVRAITRLLDGRTEIVFSSAVNRSYRVEASTDMLTWQTVQDLITGTGANIAITDTRYLPGVTELFYRVLVY